MRSENLPINWKSVHLDEICEINMGQSPPSSTYNYENEGLPFFQGKIDFGLIYPTKRVWCIEPKKIVNKGEILLSVRAPVGPTNIALEKSCIGRGLCGLKYIINESSKFIFYFFRSIENELSQLGTGSTFQAISKSQISNLKFPLPPLSEQHRIVAKLEELFTKLDVSVAELKKAKAQIKRYRQSVLKQAFEGKLTEQWRIANGELRNQTAEELLAKIKEERKKTLGAKYKELPPVDTTNLPQLPDGWVWVNLGEIGNIETGSTPSKKNPDYFGKDFPFYKPTDLNVGYNTRESEDGLTIEGMKLSRHLPVNSILVTCIGATIGKTGLIRCEGASNQQINAIIPNQLFLAEYVYFFCISEFCQRQIIDNASSTTLPILNKTKFELIPFVVASPQEQEQIVSEIERHFSVADETEKIIDQSLKQAERLRQSILKDAFSGKLVPQDPKDEPAEKLLVRIKAEREKISTSNKQKVKRK